MGKEINFSHLIINLTIVNIMIIRKNIRNNKNISTNIEKKKKTFYCNNYNK